MPLAFYPYAIEFYGMLGQDGARYLLVHFDTEGGLFEALPTFLRVFGPWSRIVITGPETQMQEPAHG